MRCLYSFLVVVCAVAVVSAQNLLTNPGFEDGETGWSLTKPKESLGSMAVQSDDVHSGDNALQVVMTTAGANAWDCMVDRLDASVTVGTEYTWSFWAKADAPTGVYCMVSKKSDWTYFAGGSKNLTTEWTQFSFNFTPNLTTSSDLYLNMQFGTKTGTFYIDDWEVVPVGGSVAAISPEAPQQNSSALIRGTTLSYSLSHAGAVTVGLYDMTGRLVKQVLNAQQNAGMHEVQLDRQHVKSGSYIVRASGPSLSIAQRVTVL